MQNVNESEALRVIRLILIAMASDRDKMKVTSIEMNGATIVNVACSVRDYARTIGSHGNNYKALKLIGEVVSLRNGNEFELGIAPPASKTPPVPEKFHYNPKWGCEQLSPLLKEVALALFGSGTVSCQEGANAILAAEITTMGDTGELPRGISEKMLEDALKLVFSAVVSPNGRRIFLKLNRYHLPDTSGGRSKLKVN